MTCLMPNWITKTKNTPINIKPNKFFSRTDLQIYLEKQGIQTRPVFTGNILKLESNPDAP